MASGNIVGRQTRANRRRIPSRLRVRPPESADELVVDLLDRRHVPAVLHGVLPSTELPESVASLAGLPANVTLPVACAELERKPTRNP